MLWNIWECNIMGFVHSVWHRFSHDMASVQCRFSDDNPLIKQVS